MCTVLYLSNPNGYIICSIRDENPNRLTLTPQIYNHEQTNFVCPLDVEKKGSWIATNSHHQSYVLLNGGFQNHIRKTSYKLSRGAIVMGLISAQDPLPFIQALDLSESEPFTIVFVYENRLSEFVWTGTDKQIQSLNPHLNHIWSSSTLYNSEAKLQRQNMFDKWIETKPNFSWESIIDFFKSYPNQENGFFMKRSPIVQTVSMSMITVNPTFSNFYYADFTHSTLQSPLIVQLNTIHDFKNLEN